MSCNFMLKIMQKVDIFQQNIVIFDFNVNSVIFAIVWLKSPNLINLKFYNKTFFF